MAQEDLGPSFSGRRASGEPLEYLPSATGSACMTDDELVDLLTAQSLEGLKVSLDRVGLRVGGLENARLRAQAVLSAVRSGKYSNGNITVGEFCGGSSPGATGR